MWGLFGLIGIIVVIYYLSKGLKKLGNWMIALGDSMSDNAEMARRKPCSSKEAVKHNKVIANKIKNISGEVSDVAYHAQVEKEIDALIRGSSKSSS